MDGVVLGLVLGFILGTVVIVALLYQPPSQPMKIIVVTDESAGSGGAGMAVAVLVLLLASLGMITLGLAG
jgi:hypothetical protein